VVKSKVARVLIKLVLIFVAITIYFYFQHPVQYRCTNLKAVFPVGDMTLVLDDIRISDLDEDKLSGRYRGGEIPWIYRMILEANLPMDWTIKLTDIVAFYSRPPRTGDMANVEFSGILVYPADVRNPVHNDSSVLDLFHFSVSPGYFSGRGGNFTYGNNYCRWNRHGTFNLDDLGKKFVLSITDQTTNKVSYIYFTPRWTKERLIKWGESWLETDPTEPAERYITHLIHDNTDAAIDYIIPGLRDRFEHPHLASSFQDADIRYTVEWVDYLVYHGAYRVTAEPVKFLNEDRTIFESISDTKLIFYVVKNDRDSKFYIGRLENLPGSD
jgi:hypothetical protein